MRDITLWTGLKIKMIYISDFYYRNKILYWQQQQNSIVALENWTINQKLKVHFLNPWNFLWVSHAYGHFINGETEAWKLKLLCPLIVSGKAKTGSQVGWLQSLCMFYDLAPKGQELRIQLGNIIKFSGSKNYLKLQLFLVKCQHQVGFGKRPEILKRSFSKAGFWPESVCFKAVNQGLGDIHINLVPSKVLTRQLGHGWISCCHSCLYAGDRAQDFIFSMMTRSF